MKFLMPFTSFGDREQASVIDSVNARGIMDLPASLMFGIVSAVYPKDSSKNLVGKYTLYSVLLSPLGTQIDNVPAMMSGGHDLNRSVPNAGSLADQNTEETPFVIGQPVLMGFINDSTLNAVILGPVACQRNTVSQTEAEYPKKLGVFQGTSWHIDKDGNANLKIKSGQNLTIHVNDTLQITVDGTNVTVGTTGTAQPVILANVFSSYFGSVAGSGLLNWMATHTHPSNGAPPLTPPSDLPGNISSTVLETN